ncbi:olfactory receptor 4P4-like [Sciurus carolinensis]|uniref:olfactory receptor 4P4-like n=1 Tax=Sciurus carolinensis TaxID=30640 RepID=UPI001FB33C5E|nr:olfactory receptor 4P4-like [Sciurus carolinensis]
MEIQRNISEFILLGLSDNKNVQIFCFTLFLLCFVALLVGNFLILISILCSPLFHQPMYYFLSQLSFLDIYYASSVMPKLIGDLLEGNKTISYGYCMFQAFTMHFFGSIEIFIITTMAFDCYVAICRPLHYMMIINRTKCNFLILAAWVGRFSHSFPQLSMTMHLPFCGVNEINHYFCDIFPLLKIACIDTYRTSVHVLVSSGVMTLVVFVILFLSYAIILLTLRNHSAEGRHKALSTCASHILVVVLFFGSAIFSYLRPFTAFPEDKVVALFYTIIAPMFNPLIYTLRNTEMKNAMRKVWSHILFSKETYS